MMESLLESYEKYIGEKVCFLCNRYLYWGVLRSIIRDKDGGCRFVELANAAIVLWSGPNDAEKPIKVDEFVRGTTIIISVDSIELISRPRWSQDELPAGDGSALVVSTSNDFPSVVEYFGKYIGKKVCFICKRYCYWGILKSIVCDDMNCHSVELANAVAVGMHESNLTTKTHVDPFDGPVMIAISAIESMHQASWTQLRGCRQSAATDVLGGE